MHADDELERWQRQWRAQPEVPLDLRRRVEHDVRGRRLALLSSIAVTVIMGGGTSVAALRSGEPNLLVLASAVWIFIAVAWWLRVRLERQRGPLRPQTETSAAFLEYAIASRRVRLKASTVSAMFYVVFFAFVLYWRYRSIGEGRPDPWIYLRSARVLTLLAVSGGLAVLAAVQRRRLNRELQNLTAMRDALERSE